MRLKDRLARHGAFAFRWRGLGPLVLLPAAIPALVESVRIELWAGETWNDLWMAACLLLSFAGLAIRVATVGFVPAGTSGRNTSGQRATRLNVTGMYSVVRNPLYLGNFVILLGIVLSLKVWWFAAVFGLAYALYIERIVMAEEDFLAGRFGAGYAAWTARTPAFWPRWRNWRNPDMAFSLRTVLRREYNGFFFILLAFTTLEAFTDMAMEGQSLDFWLADDWTWPALFMLGLAVHFTLRTLKKQTRLLHIDGR